MAFYDNFAANILLCMREKKTNLFIIPYYYILFINFKTNLL